MVFFDLIAKIDTTGTVAIAGDTAKVIPLLLGYTTHQLTHEKIARVSFKCAKEALKVASQTEKNRVAALHGALAHLREARNHYLQFAANPSFFDDILRQGASRDKAKLTALEIAAQIAVTHQSLKEPEAADDYAKLAFQEFADCFLTVPADSEVWGWKRRLREKKKLRYLLAFSMWDVVRQFGDEHVVKKKARRGEVALQDPDDDPIYYPGTEEAHTNPTRQRGECLRALAGASG